MDSYIKLSSGRYQISSHRLNKDKSELPTIATELNTNLNIMKFTLPTLIALFAALPAFAEDPPTPASEELANPVKVVFVTQWEQADFGGPEATGLEPTVLVDGENYKEVWALGPSKYAAGLSPFFPIKRDVWEDYHYFVSLHYTVSLKFC